MRTRQRQARRARQARPEASPASTEAPPSFDIAPDDPLLAYFQSSPEPVEIEKLRLDSPALEAMRAGGVKLAVPLVTQGELIGVLSLGSRLYEQELRIAHLIQQNFLPREAPELSGWRLAAFYRSARHVGGDFYDFIDLDGGRVGIVIGDVTDKGVPAALMMASTRSVIRSVAQRISAPGEVLEVVNEQLVPEMPPKMFVTCLYAVLEPETGRLVYANAGHNVPYRRAENCVDELKARGMPLGLMPGSSYEEMECTIGPGQIVLFSSDGISEAHDPDGEMFGCPRIIEIVEGYSPDEDLRDAILSSLDKFTGEDWEQEDDITMVTLERAQHEAADFAQTDRPDVDAETHAEFTVPSEPGNERMAMERVASIVSTLDLPQTKLDKLKTAVAEATMNAIEHGNENNPELLVTIEVTTSMEDVRIRITDFGGGKEIPDQTAPDLDAKLRGEQTPRGWGLFLIKAMVDELNVTYDDVHHTVELVMKLRGET